MNKEKQTLGYILLTVFSGNWCPSSRCNTILTDKKKDAEEQIGFYLNAFEYKLKQKQKVYKLKQAIQDFYKVIFPKATDTESIKFSVDNHTTFYIEINDRANKEGGNIIAAITFLSDKSRENALILWLGTMDEVLNKYRNTYIKKFGESFCRNGLSTILMRIVIKYCMISNNAGVNLWL